MQLDRTIDQPSAGRRRLLARWLGVGLIGALVGLGELDAAPTAPPASLEYEVKGAFLVKFGMFVEWPDPARRGADKKVFTIGILGADPFGDRLDEVVRKETIRGRPVQIRRASAVVELAGCEIVFISASEAARLPELLRALADQAVLTVADEPGFASAGGMIGFIKEGGKVRFEINPGAAEKAGLKLSSKLLQVGKRVAGPKPVEG